MKLIDELLSSDQIQKSRSPFLESGFFILWSQGFTSSETLTKSSNQRTPSETLTKKGHYTT